MTRTAGPEHAGAARPAAGPERVGIEPAGSLERPAFEVRGLPRLLRVEPGERRRASEWLPSGAGELFGVVAVGHPRWPCSAIHASTSARSQTVIPCRRWNGSGKRLVKRLGLQPVSLLHCFIDVDGEPLVDRLVGLCREAQRVRRDIWFHGVAPQPVSRAGRPTHVRDGAATAAMRR